jgi:catechol 2,3-dioxygenase
MKDFDSLMYGSGRLLEAGHAMEWGPGRHGPGNNVFCYFIDPEGFAVEYTTDMDQVDESHQAGSAEYWANFPKRPCRWGVAGKPSAKLAVAFAGKGLLNGP